MVRQLDVHTTAIRHGKTVLSERIPGNRIREAGGDA